MKLQDKLALNRFLGQYHPPGKSRHFRKGDPTAVDRIERLIDEITLRATDEAVKMVDRRLRDEERNFYKRARAHRKASGWLVLAAVLLLGIALSVGVR